MTTKSHNTNNKINHPDHVPDLPWKEWTLENLADSKNLWVTDIDSFIRSRKGCFILVEVKRKGAEPPTWQRAGYHILAYLLKNAEGTYIPACPEFGIKFPLYVKHFCGVHEIVFENTWFDDGKVFLNGDESSEQNIRYHLSFGAFCRNCFPDSCDDCCPSPDSDNQPDL